MKKLDHSKHYQSYLYIGYVWVVIVLIMLFLTSCYGTYYISDAEYSDLREEHASITYYDNQIYWGWHMENHITILGIITTTHVHRPTTLTLHTL